jgi:hypothetical protein
MGSWIRIRNANADPDPEGGNQPKKEEKLSLKTRKIIKISTGTGYLFSMQSYFRQRTWSKIVQCEKN